MNEHLSMDDQRLDELLAESTDRILSMDTKVEVDSATRHPELRALENTVVLLKRAIADQEPSQATSDRIRARLVAEWHQSHIRERRAAARKRRESKWNPLSWARRIPSLRTQRAFALSFTVLAILLLIAVLLFFPEIEGSNLTATVGEQIGLLPIILLAVLVVAAILFWVTRHRR